MLHIIDPIRTYAQSTPKRLAVGDAESGRRWQWAELDAAVDRLAAWLVEQLGAASGKRVAVLAKNHPLQVVLQFACIRAGAIFVPYNWRLAAAEVLALMQDAEPSLLFTTRSLCRRITQWIALSWVPLKAWVVRARERLNLRAGRGMKPLPCCTPRVPAADQKG